jgi:hypothetical protein
VSGCYYTTRLDSTRGFPEDVHPGADLWFMQRWDRARFEEALRALCEVYSPGPEWGSVASRIGRLLPWEFEYKYDQHVNVHPGPPFPP